MPNHPTLHALLDGPDARQALLDALPSYLPGQRWFTSKGQTIAQLGLRLLPSFSDEGVLALLNVEFASGLREMRVLSLALAEAQNVIPTIATVHGQRIVEAMTSSSFRESLYAFMAVAGEAVDASGRLYGEAGPLLEAQPMPASSEMPEQNSSNTVATFLPDGFLKLFRKVEPGLHPDAELIGYLSGECGFEAVPTFGGALHFQPASGGDPYSLALMLGRVEHKGEAWFNVVDDVAAFAKTFAAGPELQAIDLSDDLEAPLLPADMPQVLRQAMGENSMIQLIKLGRRTAEMHLHFAAGERGGIRPEALEESYWTASRAALDQRISEQIALAEPGTAQTLLALQTWVGQQAFPSYAGGRIRVHGDYHLGQVLDTVDGDLRIIDFEGEPLHSLEYRRRRHPAFKDLAGMVRSLHYAPNAYAMQQAGGSPEALSAARLWYATASRLYLTAYFEQTGDASFLPQTLSDRRAMLAYFLVDKVLYELAYERASRPDWLSIPQNGIAQIARLVGA